MHDRDGGACVVAAGGVVAVVSKKASNPPPPEGVRPPPTPNPPPPSRTGGELRTLEREIAESCARSDIECHCLSQDHSGRYYGRWYDLATMDEDDREIVGKSVRYLELRKLIRRHPENRDLVQLP